MTVERGQGAWEADCDQQHCDNRRMSHFPIWNGHLRMIPTPPLTARGYYMVGGCRKSTKSTRKLELVLLPVLAEAGEQASKGLAT
jgi:hypothetical protein